MNYISSTMGHETFCFRRLEQENVAIACNKIATCPQALKRWGHVSICCRRLEQNIILFQSHENVSRVPSSNFLLRNIFSSIILFLKHGTKIKWIWFLFHVSGTNFINYRCFSNNRVVSHTVKQNDRNIFLFFYFFILFF